MNDQERPDQFRYGLGYGTVVELYPDSWEVDILSIDGGLVTRALVIGQRFPEKSTQQRPQWAAFGYCGHQAGQPICWPVESRLTGPRFARAGFVSYDERDNYRLTIDTDGNWQIRNLNGDVLTRIRIEQTGPRIIIETPEDHIVLDRAAKKILVQTTGDLETTVGKNMTATVGGDATADVVGKLEATAASAKITAPGGVVVVGDVTIQGNLNVTGTINA